MIYSKILSTGSYLPQQVMTNHDFAERMDTSDEWIRTRTGIEQRHIAAANESSTDLAYYAATTRSEERRVGKECRSRWSPYH